MHASWRALGGVLAGLVCLLAAGGAQAERRIALVVGNDTYAHVEKLEKAVNDAVAMADALKARGFEVILARNADRRELLTRLSELNARVQAGDLALFFFSGHGVEVRGTNYVLATDVPALKPGQETLLTGEAIPTDKIIADLQDRGARATVLVLDACRDNPFKRGGTRSVGGVRGLSIAAPPEGVFVLYSAGVGQSALDRTEDGDPDPNSVFTRVLLRHLGAADATLLDIAKATQVEVRELALSVKHTQVPAYYDQIIGQLRLGPAPEAAPAKPSPGPKARPPVEERRPPPVASQPPTTQPGDDPSARPRVALNNKGFDWLMKERYRSDAALRRLALPEAVATCDRLTSFGLDNPDSRAPRVPLDRIDTARAIDACVAAVRQDPAAPRLRLQLARALLAAKTNDKKEKLTYQIGALEIMLNLAEDGYPAAMWRIGVAYYSGSGVKKDLERAVRWFTRAADKGLVIAMSDLAHCYEHGEGVEKDEALAGDWLERAAAGGHPTGMRNFALVLDRGGYGRERDPARSAELLLTAFRMGAEDARKSLFELHGSWGQDTKAEVQQLLRSYGLYGGRTDGVFDAPTFAALETLAKQNPARQ